MAINTPPKEMPTVGGNPTAGGAINDLDYPTGQRPSKAFETLRACLLYTSPSPRDGATSRMPSSA